MHHNATPLPAECNAAEANGGHQPIYAPRRHRQLPSRFPEPTGRSKPRGNYTRMKGSIPRRLNIVTTTTQQTSQLLIYSRPSRNRTDLLCLLRPIVNPATPSSDRHSTAPRFQAYTRIVPISSLCCLRYHLAPFVAYLSSVRNPFILIATNRTQLNNSHPLFTPALGRTTEWRT